MTSVLLIEEHSVVREGVRLLLEAEGFDVCGGVSTLAAAVEGTWAPDVVIHELLLTDCYGLEVVTRLRMRFPTAALMVLTSLETSTYVHLALAVGASGYVLKSAEPFEVIDAVMRIAKGGQWVQPRLAAALAKWDEIPRRHDKYSLFSLTMREQEVLELIALGHTNAEVASALVVAVRTVEAHRTHVTQKLGLRSRAELARFVAEQRRSNERPSPVGFPAGALDQ
jgi:two-component system, NarL family, response regulator NreC